MRLLCSGCRKTPRQIPEYRDAALAEETTPNDYVREHEGTLNRANGHFLCTKCYIVAGMPSRPGGWVAP